MKYKISYTHRFKRALRLAAKRGLNLDKIQSVIRMLEEDGKLPPEYHPHILSGNYAGVWECHIASDWLLLWEQDDKELTLLMLNTGTHSDVF